MCPNLPELVGERAAAQRLESEARGLEGERRSARWVEYEQVSAQRLDDGQDGDV